MDLGLSGKNAVVCASSRGLGLACATELAKAGCRVVVNGRDAAYLEQIAETLRRDTGTEIVAIPGDIGSPAVRDVLLTALPHVDILVNNNAGPPFRDFREIDRDAMLKGIEANMLTPIELVRRVIDGMVERRFGRIVNITSLSVKSPIAGLDLSSGARAGLTGFLAGIARSVAHSNVTINFLLPGSFDTRRLRTGQEHAAERSGLDIEAVREKDRIAIPAKRFGEPAEFGAACAYLCSAQAGYITGQSFLIDGGVYPGVL